MKVRFTECIFFPKALLVRSHGKELTASTSSENEKDREA